MVKGWIFPSCYMYDLKIGQDCERAFTDKVVTTKHEKNNNK